MSDTNPFIPFTHQEYRFSSSWEGDGEILDSNNQPRWRYGSVGRKLSVVGSYGFFKLPVFAVKDLDGREILNFKRIKRFPRSVFQISEGGRDIGTITSVGLLFNKYRLDFQSGMHRGFQMPLFKIWFRGTSDNGGRIAVKMWSHRMWLVAIESSIDSFHLAASLAFIHRERLRHG